MSCRSARKERPGKPTLVPEKPARTISSKFQVGDGIDTELVEDEVVDGLIDVDVDERVVELLDGGGREQGIGIHERKSGAGVHDGVVCGVTDERDGVQIVRGDGFPGVVVALAVHRDGAIPLVVAHVDAVDEPAAFDIQGLFDARAERQAVDELAERMAIAI